MAVTPLKILTLLPWPDWLALAGFFVAWIGYAVFARRRSVSSMSLLATTNHYRHLWMVQTTWRDVRVVDGVVLQNLSTSPSFFASTTILIIGGLLALLGTSERANALVQEIPFAARTSAAVFDFKLLVLTGVFVYAFFRFTWSLRQYTFGALMVAAAPDFRVFERGEASREEFADRAGRVLGLAAESFNDGLRAYYMSFAVIGWFFSPLVFAVGSAGVVYVLFQREFQSEVLAVLKS
ncbi:DUF599 domain-containing protein [Caldimonas brevitalea]|uniref:Membrane protein n=1 Tax=Caldimonas brevitalea TaxID=413882 RepID=A0A0G3BR09_9BURK|nr:DUF599 domain-containing protein [Caldimonas brevitalea]AKJ30433.1 membrane protein [Caldimonas brevitalea]